MNDSCADCSDLRVENMRLREVVAEALEKLAEIAPDQQTDQEYRDLMTRMRKHMVDYKANYSAMQSEGIPSERVNE